MSIFLKIFQRAFVTSDGRPNLFWHLLLYLLSLLLILAVLQIGLLKLLKWIGVPRAFLGIIYAPLAICLILVLTWLFRHWVDRRPWQGIGFLRQAMVSYLPGFAFGTLLVCLVFVGEYALGWLHLVETQVDVSGVVGSLGWLVLGLLVPFTTGIVEETAFRGYVFQNLGESLPVWLAILITGIIFGYFHVGLTNSTLSLVLEIFSLVIFSTMLVLVRLSSGTLWMAMGIHGAWDWAQGSLFGLAFANTPPDYSHALLHLTQSGPAIMVGRGTGVEMGFFVMLIEVLGLVLIWLWMRWSGQRIAWGSRLTAEGQRIAELQPQV